MAPDEPPREELEQRIREREERISTMKEKLGRADAFEESQRKDRIATSVKLSALAVGALLLLAGGVWAVGKMGDFVPDSACKFHEHATFRVFVDGQFLIYQHPEF
ncbi:MAG: hypothetical protein ACRDHY_03290, partial [Anaerolineales bacterium]